MSVGVLGGDERDGAVRQDRVRRGGQVGDVVDGDGIDRAVGQRGDGEKGDRCSSCPRWPRRQWRRDRSRGCSRLDRRARRHLPSKVRRTVVGPRFSAWASVGFAVSAVTMSVASVVLVVPSGLVRMQRELRAAVGELRRKGVVGTRRAGDVREAALPLVAGRIVAGSAHHERRRAVFRSRSCRPAAARSAAGQPGRTEIIEIHRCAWRSAASSCRRAGCVAVVLSGAFIGREDIDAHNRPGARPVEAAELFEGLARRAGARGHALSEPWQRFPDRRRRRRGHRPCRGRSGRCACSCASCRRRPSRAASSR